MTDEQAPEVIARNGVQTIDANVYSFGTLIYQLGSGIDPLSSKTQKEVNGSVALATADDDQRIKMIHRGVELVTGPEWMEHLTSIVVRW